MTTHPYGALEVHAYLIANKVRLCCLGSPRSTIVSQALHVALSRRRNYIPPDGNSSYNKNENLNPLTLDDEDDNGGVTDDDEEINVDVADDDRIEEERKKSDYCCSNQTDGVSSRYDRDLSGSGTICSKCCLPFAFVPY